MNAAGELDIAVIGASGLVGEMMIQLLEERDFPVRRLYALGSDRSLGRSVQFRGQSVSVRDLARFDFSSVQLALFAADERIAREHVPRALAAGCAVIDDSPAYRGEPDVPLVVPELNPEALAHFGARRIVCSPGGSSLQLALALHPIHVAAEIQRVWVATYEPLSGAGREAVEELAAQSIQLLSGRGPVTSGLFPGQIAFNCVPQVGSFEADGYTSCETQLVGEIRRLLDEPGMRISATAVQVPVFYGLAQVVSIETRRALSVNEARALLTKAPGIRVQDEGRAGGYPTAATEAANRDTVYVGRIREDLTPHGGLNLWVVADNVRKGAATNCVQIAEILVRQHM